MRWLRGNLENQIRSDDDRFVIYREQPEGKPPRYIAWGPVGSQEIDYIQQCTAAALRNLLQVERRPTDLKMTAGRALIGVFGSGDDARDACIAADGARDVA